MDNMFIKLTLKILIIYLFFLPYISFAQDAKEKMVDGETRITQPALIGCDQTTGVGCTFEKGLEKSVAVKKVLPQVIKTMMLFAAAMSLIFIIYSGWQYIIALGDDNTYTQAKNNILYSIIGLIISILSYAIVDIVSSITWV